MMRDNGSSAINMLQGPPWKILLLFAFPLMLGNAFQQVYTLTDAAVVGRTLGIYALAALGACDTLLFLINSSIQAFASGCGIRISATYGEQDEKGMRDTIYASGVCCLVFGCILCLAVQMLLPWILQALRVQTAVAPLTRLYLRIICLGIPLVTVYQYFFAVIRSLGNSQVPLRIMVVSSCINIVLDILFVRAFGWGIAGAAAATVMAQAVSVVCGAAAVRRTTPPVTHTAVLSCRYRIPHVLGLSLPMSLQMAVCCISSLIVQAAINKCSVSFIAGYTATNKLYGLLEVAAIAYGYAITTYISQNAGNGNGQRIRQGVKAGEWIALVTAAVLMICITALRRPLVQLFMSGQIEDLQPAIAVGCESLMALTMGLPLLYTLYVLKSTLQGLGEVRFSSISSAGEFMARLIVVLLAAGMNRPAILYLSEPAAWGIGSAILLAGAVYGVRHHHLLAAANTLKL